MTANLPSKQYQALRKLCDIYWSEFECAELKHDLISDGLKIYSSGADYVHFYPVKETFWKDVGICYDGSIEFKSKDISEEAFSKALTFIRKELGKKIISHKQKLIREVEQMKAELKKKRKELKVKEARLKDNTSVAERMAER